jgi:hypothetical protein
VGESSLNTCDVLGSITGTATGSALFLLRSQPNVLADRREGVRGAWFLAPVALARTKGRWPARHTGRADAEVWDASLVL